MQTIVKEDGCTDPASLASKHAAAVALIQNIYDTHPTEKIGISFNGGKDSVVMVELVKQAVGIEALRASVVFFLDTGDDFDEMNNFRDQFGIDRLPGVALQQISADRGLCDGLWTVKNQFDIEVVFMGTRRTDPSGKYQRNECARTTSGWPPMLRVCPVFSWTVTDIWSFTKREKLPFCSLYLRGYTSLGGSQVTSPNNALRNDDGSFAPAWALKDHDDERSGRLSQSDNQSHSPSSP